MKKFTKLFISLIAAVVLAIPVLCAACSTDELGDPVDYVGPLKLDLTSVTKKQEVTVRLFVDGDTTHFDPKKDSTITSYNAADFTDTEGYIKARYIAINTPESTGKIEEWGKKASNFTRSKLETAQSIIVESDNDQWNLDSSGSKRHVVWVWYQPKGEADYRNLNVEILQEGLAFGSSVRNNRYGEVAFNALSQAMAFKYHVFSDGKDPDFPYGVATPVTLKELRCNIKDYDGSKVKVEGVVVAEYNNSVYIEAYDEEEDMYFGMSVYYGYQTGKILDILSIGNKVSVVGVVSYYEGGGTYQISGVSYDEYNPKLASNTTLISKNNPLAFREVSAKDLVSGKYSFTKEVKTEDGVTIEQQEIAYGEAVMSTSVTVKDLHVEVKDTYTTKNGNSKGAMSLSCKAADGTIITVRTEPLKDKDGKEITHEQYVGKTITVKGLVDKYQDKYQIKVYRIDFLKTAAELADEETADKAVKVIETLYADKSDETPSDYNLVGKVAIDGVNYDVTWTVNTEAEENVAIGTMNEELFVPVAITKGETAIEYTLTATVTVGTATKTIEFTFTIPALEQPEVNEAA